jgi:tetratricopeptide (TPR) repeat protein
MEPASIVTPLLGAGFCAGIIIAFYVQRRWIRGAWEKGMAAYERNDFAEVRKAFLYVVKKHPGWATARRMLARGLVGLGKHAEAEQELRMAAQLEPRNAEGHIDLAIFLASLSHERHEEAVACIETALDVAPDMRTAVATLPQLRSLHSHPRFRNLAGLPDTKFTAARLN